MCGYRRITTLPVHRWAVDYDGAADFRYLFADEMHVTRVITDLEQALAGGQIISKSVAMLAEPFEVPDPGSSATFIVEDLPSAPGVPAFEYGDYVRFARHSRDEGGLDVSVAWGTVSDYVDLGDGRQQWTFTRSVPAEDDEAPGYDIRSGYLTGTVPDGALVLDYGVEGNGYYEVTAVDGLWGANAPYAQTAVWDTHPAYRRVTARLGNLRGIFAQADEHGLYAGTGVTDSDKYLRLSNVKVAIHNVPLRLYDEGSLRVDIDAVDTPHIAVGTPPPQDWLDATGIWTGIHEGLPKAYVGEVTAGTLVRGWQWDGSDLVVRGTVYVSPTGDAALADWVHPSDQTKINGGMLYTGSVHADALTVRGKNLLQNPSFELGTTGWVEGGAFRQHHTAPNAHTGASYISGRTGGEDNQVVTTEDYIPCAAGEQYTAIAWMRDNVPGWTSCGIMILFYDVNREYLTYASNAHLSPRESLVLIHRPSGCQEAPPD